MSHLSIQGVAGLFVTGIGDYRLRFVMVSGADNEPVPGLAVSGVSGLHIYRSKADEYPPTQIVTSGVGRDIVELGGVMSGVYEMQPTAADLDTTGPISFWAEPVSGAVAKATLVQGNVLNRVSLLTA